MQRANAFHLLSLVLACFGMATWARAVDCDSSALLSAAIALLLSSAGFSVFSMRAAKKNRERLVRQLRDAAAGIRPADTSFSNFPCDAEALGTAADSLIAAHRAQSMTGNERIRELELRLAAATLERDEARGAISGLHHAVTEVSQAAQSTGAQAQAGTRVANELLTLVNHELRTPLASIRACSEMLLDDEAVDARSRQELYQVIYGETGRLADAIESVMLLARLRAGLVRPQPTEAQLTSLARDAVVSVVPIASARNIALQVNPEDSGGLLRVDPMLIRRAIHGLLLLAMKSLRTGGRIVLHTLSPTDAARIQLQLEISAPDGEPKLPVEWFDTVNRESPFSAGSCADGIDGTLARLIVEDLHRGRLLGGTTLGFELHLVPETPVPSLATTSGESHA